MCGYLAGTPITLEAAAFLLGYHPVALARALDRLGVEPRYMRLSNHPRLHRVVQLADLEGLRRNLVKRKIQALSPSTPDVQLDAVRRP
jgi:hypothetical protein